MIQLEQSYKCNFVRPNLKFIGSLPCTWLSRFWCTAPQIFHWALAKVVNLNEEWHSNAEGLKKCLKVIIVKLTYIYIYIIYIIYFCFTHLSAFFAFGLLFLLISISHRQFYFCFVSGLTCALVLYMALCSRNTYGGAERTICVARDWTKIQAP